MPIEKFEVTSSRFSYNMAGWCTEKSSEVVTRLTELNDVLKDSSIPDEIRMNLQGLLRSAMYDALKLLTFSTGADWRPDDAEQALRGKRDFERLMLIYGVSPHYVNPFQANLDLAAKCKGLLEGPRAPNRTTLHETLDCNLSNFEPEFEILRKTLEKCIMGEIAWDVFASKGNKLMLSVTNRMNDELSSLNCEIDARKL